MIGANTGGLIGMSKEHLAITLALSVPVVVVISKIDMTPANVLQETIKQLVKVLKSPGSRFARRHFKTVNTYSDLAGKRPYSSSHSRLLLKYLKSLSLDGNEF